MEALRQLSFEPGLNNDDRAVVHSECKKYGFSSKSYGLCEHVRSKGEDRHVVVFKERNKAVHTRDATELSVSAQTRRELDDLFSRVPPTPAELAAVSAAISPSTDDMDCDATDGEEDGLLEQNSSSGPEAGPLPLSDEERGRIALKWHKHRAKIQGSRHLLQLDEARRALPIYAMRDSVLAAMQSNQVILIAGETGCGKTTQIPQYILEDSWSRQMPAKIICTQPRRISAISVAERVATEFGEVVGKPDSSIGYQVRLDTQVSSNTVLTFCTNGILLRKLTITSQHDHQLPGVKPVRRDPLEGVTHIIVDEIHERDRFADFMLIVLRDLLKRRPSLRLVLMSATLNAELFSSYFGGCPIVRVPGFTHPVRSYFLEDVLARTGFVGSVPQAASGEYLQGEGTSEVVSDAAMDALLENAWLKARDADFDELLAGVKDRLESGSLAGGRSPLDYQHTETGATALMVTAGKGKGEVVAWLLSQGVDVSLKAYNGSSATDWAYIFGQEEAHIMVKEHAAEVERSHGAANVADALSKYQASTNMDEVDLNLIEMLLEYICGGGWQAAQGGANLAPDGAILVFLPGWDEMSRLRDNLASSSTFKSSKFSILLMHSRVATAEQKRVFERPPHGVRKIVLATNIAETAITIDDVVFVIDCGKQKEKNYDPYTNVSTLQMTWTSKANERQRRGRAGRVRPGVCYHMYSRARSKAHAEFNQPELKRTPLEELCLQVKLLAPHTRIEEFLAKAVEPPISKAVENAVSTLQDIGAIDGKQRLTDLGRHLASLPLHPRIGKMLLFAVIFQCFDPLLTAACAHSQKDPFVLPISNDQRRQAIAARQKMSNMYGGNSDQLAISAAFEQWVHARSRGHDQMFCNQNFLSSASMQWISDTREQLTQEMQHLQLVPRYLQAVNQNCQDRTLVRAVLAAGTYPLVGKVTSNSGRTFMVTKKGEKVRIHQHSVNIKLEANSAADQQASLLVFDELTRGESMLNVRSSTLVQPHPFILFAAKLTITPSSPDTGHDTPMMEADASDASMSLISVDDWLHFTLPTAVAHQLCYLRQRLLQVFERKVQDPAGLMPADHIAAVQAAAAILSLEGGSDSLNESHRGPQPAPILPPHRTSPPAAILQRPQPRGGTNHITNTRPVAKGGRGGDFSLNAFRQAVQPPVPAAVFPNTRGGQASNARGGRGGPARGQAFYRAKGS
eukprot:jgi/Chlat1/1386/Chrsp12S02051